MDFNILLEESADAIIATAPTGEVIFWNKGAEAMFGYTRQEAIGHSLDELIVPADRIEEEKRILHEALANDLATYESLRRKKDGSLIFVDITSKSVRDAQGRIELVLSNKKDVTHLKVLRDAKLIEAKYQDLLESTPDAIVIVNVTGRIVLANNQAEKAFGYQRRELLGRPVELLKLDQRLIDGASITKISVEDTGIGIRAEDQARLFQAFSQVDASERRPHESTGLGLHLSGKLAELLGGKITFTSELGKGSTFSLEVVDKQGAVSLTSAPSS